MVDNYILYFVNELSTERGTINVAFALNDVEMKDSEIEEYTKTMEEIYKQYTDDINVNFFERNNHTVGEIKFVTPASDTNIYNHIVAFSVNGKLRLVTFNCTEELRDEWEEVGDFIIKSLVFNEKTN